MVASGNTTGRFREGLNKLHLLASPKLAPKLRRAGTSSWSWLLPELECSMAALQDYGYVARQCLRGRSW